jgi:uncharacterized protein
MTSLLRGIPEWNGRTLQEIGLWDQMTEALRADVMASLPARQPWRRNSSPPAAQS